MQKDERVCKVCGCTSTHACEGGCYWVKDDLCSRCAGLEDDVEDEEKSYEELYPDFDIKGFSNALMLVVAKHIKLLSREEFHSKHGQAWDKGDYCNIPHDKFLMLEGNAWSAIDNSEGSCWAEGFDNALDAIEWLIDKRLENYEIK